MKKLRKDKFRKILAFMVALALMVSCVPSAYTISASETFGDGTDDLFTDGEGSSGPEAEESTPDVSSADQEKQAQQTMLTYENDSVKVTAEALEEGSLPQNTSLRVDTVNENTSVSYDTVSQKLSKAAEDKGSSLRGFFALDVYFADADGNRVEPNGRVKVTIEYKTPAAPELTDAANTSVTVEKLRYNSSTGETEAYVLQPNEDLKVLNVTETKQVQIIQAETGNSAVFAVMWDSPETVSGEDENSDTPIDSEGNDSDVDISDGEITPEPEVTEVPAEEPEVTEAPTEEPTVTEAPAEEPEVTEAPTEEPTVTEAPAEEPEVTEVPEEEPEITQVPSEEAVIVTVIGDDVNLRVSPSEDADVVTTVEAGTQLTVLETVTAEDGTTWYRVSYEGTEAYIRSDMVQVVETGDEEPAEEEVTDDLTQEGPVTYSKTVGNVVVTATADKDVLPEDAKLVVTPVEKDNAQYSEVESQLHAKAEEGDYTVAGFLAYDIYFQDSDGNKIHPDNGKVKVSMAYQDSSVPEEVKEATAETLSLESESNAAQENTNSEQKSLSISVMHLVEDENGNINVVDMTEDGSANVEANADGEIQKAEFETESFSVFTITWKRTGLGSFDFTKEIYMVKSSNNGYTELTATVSTGNLTLETEDTNPVLYLDTITSTGINKVLYRVTENGNTYLFQGAYIATKSGSTYKKVSEEKISVLTGRLENNQQVMKYKDKNDTKYKNLASNQYVIFVYANDTLTNKALLYAEDGTALRTTSNNNSANVALNNLGSTVLDVQKNTTNNLVPKNAYTWNGNTITATYTYKYAVVGTGAESTEIKYLRKGEVEGLQYSEDGESWNDVGSQTIKFVYGISSGDYKSIETANTRGLIDIDLYNYQNNMTYDSNMSYTYYFNRPNWEWGYKTQNGYKFGQDAGWTGSSSVTQGLVSSELVNGFPVLNSNGQTYKSLDGLFSNKSGTSAKTVAEGLNHLFQYDSATGLYSYDSDTNYAYYNIASSNSEKNFIVYDKKDYHGSTGSHKTGAFMPFSSLTDNTASNKYAFGMKVSFDFMQPKNGQINGKDMIFSFSGDDDVWVFVDNKLVLDLGGVHDMASGTINFRTGEVKVNDTVNTSLQNIFGKLFSDYSSHTLKFFYLERGEGESNCSLKFNLPPVPTNSIEVAKALGNSDKEKYTSTDFKFKAYLQDEDDTTGKQFNAIPTGTTFKVKKNGVLTGETRVVGEHNIFSLKAGESAVFEGISSGLLFYAEEVGIESDQFDVVDVNDWKVTYYDKDGNEITNTSGKVPAGQNYIARSETKTAGDSVKVIFSNNCSGKNLRKLQITKKMTEGQATTDTFNFKVYLSGQDGKLIPYDGSYVIKRANGIETLGVATSEGVISDVGMNDTIVIDQILSGTEFKVEEYQVDLEKYATPTKKVTGCKTEELSNSDSDGKLELEKDALVTVTNDLKTKFTVIKNWSGDPEETTHDSVYVGLYKTDGTPAGSDLYAELNESNGFTYTFNGVSKEYTAYELREAGTDETPEYTINNVGYVKIENDGYSKVNTIYLGKTKATNYKVTYSEKTESTENNIVSQSITNTKIETQVSIVKIKKGDASTTLKDAEFSLYLAGENGNYTEDDLVQSGIKTDNSGKKTITNLTPGTYVLVETKAPTGYLLSEKTWKIAVALDGTVTVTYDGKPVNQAEGNYLIENSEVYTLPSAGGPGIYGFTISGVAILATALLLFIKNKRREEEAKRS